MNAQRNSRRKVRAVLAGGLVLGVGAVVTLASWNDSEFVTGTFQAGSFNLEGSTEGPAEGFSDHSEGNAANLTFELPLAGNLSPGDVVHAPFWVRLDADTTSPADLVLEGIDSTGDNAEHLSYVVTELNDAEDCEAGAEGTDIGESDDLNSVDGVVPAELEDGELGEAGEAVHLCFAVTAGDDLIQGEGATATWQLTATSK